MLDSFRGSLTLIPLEDIASALHSCGKQKNVPLASSLYAFLCQNGLETQHLLGNYLVPMWVQVGQMGFAQQVVNRLTHPNEWSWNSLINGYIKSGNPQKALDLYHRIQSHVDHTIFSGHTFVAILKACGKMRNMKAGIQIHDQIEGQELFKRNFLIRNALIYMYCKCGLLPKAQQVFDEIRVRTAVSWTSMIAGCVDHGHGEKALVYFGRMQHESILPDSVTAICSLKACAALKFTNKGLEIHAKIDREGFLETDLVVGNTLIDMYIKCDSLERAKHLFNRLPMRDTVSWTTLISGYVEHGHTKEALNCFSQMQLEGITPDVATFTSTLKACGILRNLQIGGMTHAEVERQGLLERNISIGNTLVDMYAKCGLLVKANEVFIRLPAPDVVSWTALIAGYAEHHCNDEALDCFERMQLDGVTPNDVTFICILKVCASTGATAKGSQIHHQIEKQGLLDRNVVIGTTLIDMYSKWGVLSEAQKVFDRLPTRDGVSWTALMTGYAKCRENENVLNIFEGMIAEGLKPNLVTFIILLGVCNSTSPQNKGQTYIETMRNEFGIGPNLVHHTCMLNLLLRDGQLGEAMAMIRKMPFCPDAVIWHALLGACRHWGNEEFGKNAFEEALQLDGKEPAAFGLLSEVSVDSTNT